MSERTGSRRRLVAHTTLGAGVLLAVALFLFVNYFGWKYHQRFDWTESRLYTLSDKSLSVLAGLDREVDAVVFLSPGQPLFEPVKELLARYEAASPRLGVRHVDAEKNLLEAQSLVDKYQLSQLDVVVFDSGDDRRVVPASDLAEFDYSGVQFGQGPTVAGLKAEQRFTSTLLELVESRKPKILFTTGHGELALDDFSPRGLSTARDLLGEDNFELEEWGSLGKPSVPEGTDLIVVAGPISGFIEPEIEVLRDYLEGGGRLLALLDPTLAETGGLVPTGLEALVADYGVRVGDDIVVDPDNPLPFFGPETLFVGTYSQHTITRPLNQAQLPTIVALARSVGEGEPVEGLAVSELMLTTGAGWGETDLDNLTEVERHEGDLAGPVSIAVAVEPASAVEDGPADFDAAAPAESDAIASDSTSRETGASGTGLRLAVFGDSDFASNAQLSNAANYTLLANTLNWLVEREALVSIPPKKPEQVKLNLTRSQLTRITWLVLVVMPGLSLLLGGFVYWRRRH